MIQKRAKVRMETGRVRRAVEKAKPKSTREMGALIYRIARNSIRFRKDKKQRSASGKPPFTHTKALKNSIRFDADEHSVVVGPTRSEIGHVGHTHEFGGSEKRTSRQKKSGFNNVTLNLEKGEADVTTRGANGWKEVLPTLKEASIDFEAVWDTENEHFKTLLDAFLNDVNIEFLFLDGAVTKKGSQGLRAVCGVFKFSRDEQLDGALIANTSVKPTYGAVKPSWFVVETGTP